MTTKFKHIEKYDFDTIKREKKPYTVIRTAIVQKIPIKHAQEFLLWVYLESLCETWKPTKSHLTKHFQISDRTYERYMSWLNAVGLIEYRQTRSSGGTFGKGKLIVLNGSRFNLDAASNRTVKIDDTVIDKRKKKKLSTENDITEPTNLSLREKNATAQAQLDESLVSPHRQNTAVRLNDAHIKTINRNRKAIRKTKPKNSVSVFSDSLAVRNHLESVLAERELYPDEDLMLQILFYVGAVLGYDEVIKKINIALKTIREGKWNIPHGYNGVTSQSIREKEENYQRQKKAQYEQDAQAFKNLKKAIASPKPYISMAQRLAEFRDGMNANSGAMQA